jgi:hypothetical protein
LDKPRIVGGPNEWTGGTPAQHAANDALNGFALPTDPAPDRLVLSIYTIAPIGFTFRQPGTDTWSEVEYWRYRCANVIVSPVEKAGARPHQESAVVYARHRVY